MKTFFLILATIFLSLSPFLSELTSCPMRIESFQILNDSKKPAENKTEILLTNGMKWLYSDNDLFEGTNCWKVDDRMNITYVYLEGYYLKNTSYQGCIPVKLQNRGSEELITKTILTIIKSKDAFKIVLDDSTEWFVGWWSGVWMEDWKEGDRIVVTPQDFVFGNADHLLINLDSDKKSLAENVRAQLMFSPETLDDEDFNKREPLDRRIFISNLFEKDNSFIIELNNGVSLKSSNLGKGWRRGDYLELDLSKRRIILTNLRTDEERKAQILISGSELAVIDEIKEKEGKIILSDDSVWLSNSRPFKSWKEGDRIIVSQIDGLGFDTSTHTLINVDSTDEKGNLTSIKSTIVK